MPPRFEFATAGRIVFGAGTLAEIGKIARDFGRHALIVTGRDQQRAAPLLAHLAAAEIATTVLSIDHEPASADIIRGRARTQASKCDFVIGFGGGSAIDSAKAISALMTNDREIFNYLEVIGRGQPLSSPAAPCIAIPTTAGTGAEVTRNRPLRDRPQREGQPAQRAHASARRPDRSRTDVQSSSRRDGEHGSRRPHAAD